MIVVSLMGGLGNQMFQYALMCSLRSRGRRVRMDESSCFEYAPRTDPREHSMLRRAFGLDYPCTRNPFLRWRAADSASFSEKLFAYFSTPFLPRYREQGLGFDSSVLQMRNQQLIGYWQSERYFSDTKVQAQLRRDFRCPDSTLSSATFKAWYNRIRQDDSVALHIRRGDYLKYPELYGDICTDAYYERAIDHIKKERPEAVFYVFSDDKNYAHGFAAQQAAKHKSSFHVVDDASLSDHDEFFLMRYCRHHIVANSSFSWWASWLGDDPEQIILAPEKWIHNKSGADDIYTARMTKIPIA